MKYKKGTFVIVPNLERLDLLPSTSQALYIWICKYANDDGECFPSRNKLAKHIGCDVRTVDKHINFLIDLGFMTKEIRHKKGSKENMSNLYQLQLIRHPSEVIDTTPSEINDTVTISNINHTNITKEVQPKVANKIIGDKILPIERGDTPLKRVISIYNTLFFKEYGISDNQPYGKKAGIFTSLLKEYTELQLAYLLIVFFTWNGMSGQDKREREFLVNNTHSVGLFKAGLNKYLAWTKNVSGYDKEFDSSDELLPIVGKYIISLTNN